LKAEPLIASLIFDEVFAERSVHRAIHHDALDRLPRRDERSDPAARTVSKEKHVLAIHEIIGSELFEDADEHGDLVLKADVATGRAGAVSDSALLAPHDGKTRPGQAVDELAGEVWFRKGPLDRIAPNPLQVENRRQLARIARRLCQEASQLGLVRVDDVVEHLNVPRLLPRPLADAHIDIQFLPTSLDTARDAVPGFEGFHRGQEGGTRIDGGAVERQHDVPTASSDSAAALPGMIFLIRT